MNIAIIKYNAGNVKSVQNALSRMGAEACLTDNHSRILNADRVIFPGVGNAFAAMESLKEKQLDELITRLDKPVLGICVGMQLLCLCSEENNTKGLGIVPVKVKKFDGRENRLKIPQVGWNSIHDLSSGLFQGVKDGSFVYYVHSFYAETGPYTIAATHYGVPFSAAIRKDNFYGVQFHTEKSAEAGEQILDNFLKLK